MISSKIAFRASLIAGLIALALTIVGGFQAPAPSCGGLPASYPQIVAFELVRSVSDLHALFGASAGACRAAVVSRMDFINWVDTFAFIPAYGAFLIFFFLGQRPKHQRLAAAAIAVMAISCLADYAENYALFHLSADPDHPKWIPFLIGATETKWIGIGIAGALGASTLWEGGRGLDWLAALLGGIGLAATLVTLVASAKVGPYLSNAIALGWLVFLAVDLREVFFSRASA